MNQPNIFICYCQEDSKWFVGRLLDSLNSHLDITISNIFLDVVEIKEATNLKERIFEAIDNCHIFLVVIGNSFLIHDGQNKNSEVISPYVEDEIEYALEKKKCILPVLFDDSKMPNSEQIDSKIRELIDIKAFTFRYEDWDKNFPEFSRIIKDLHQEFINKLEEKTEFVEHDTFHGTLKDNRDDNSYNAVKILSKWWLVQNFSLELKRGSYYYKNDPSNKEEYGLLYDWNAIWNAIPSGWRIPTEEEWIILLGHAQGDDKTIKKLFENQENSSENSFQLKLGGMGDEERKFCFKGEYGEFWGVSNNGKAKGKVKEFPWFVRINTKNEIEFSKVERITAKVRSLILIKDETS